MEKNAYRWQLEQQAEQRSAAPRVDWAITVFASREGPQLETCLDALDSALAGWPSVAAHVVVNGGSEATAAHARAALERWRHPAAVVEIPFGDKANAWNQYIYGLRPGARWHLFVDGYVAPDVSGLDKLRTRFEAADALAATGVPSGEHRGAVQMREFVQSHGGILGGLHAIRGEWLDRLVRRGILQPWGLYRGDGLIGSWLCHDLDPLAQAWDKDRILVVPEATWQGERLSPFAPRDLLTQWRRMQRQAQGRMENRAIKDIIYREGYEGLPQSARELVEHALNLGPGSNDRSLTRRLLRGHVTRRLRRTPEPEPQDFLPRNPSA